MTDKEVQTLVDNHPRMSRAEELEFLTDPTISDEYKINYMFYSYILGFIKYGLKFPALSKEHKLSVAWMSCEIALSKYTKPDYRFSSIAFTIFRNKLFTESGIGCRKEPVQWATSLDMPMGLDESTFHDVTDDPNVEGITEVIGREHEVERLRELVNTILTDKEKEVMLLRMKGYTHDLIGEELGLLKQTIHVRYKSALKKLQDAFESEYYWKKLRSKEK